MPATPILFCSHVVELGGAENVLLDLLAELDRERFTPHLAIPHAGPLTSRAAELGVSVHEVPLAGRSRLQKALAAIRARRALRQLAERLDCRVLVANSMIAGYAAVRARHRNLACVWHLHIVTRAMIARAALRRATAVIAPSQAALDAAYIANGTVIANGVPDRFFTATKSGLRQKLAIPDGAPLLGIVGRLDPRKGHEVLLRSLADWPQTENAGEQLPHLVIAGGELFADSQARLAGYGEHLRQTVRQLSLDPRVHWLGELDDTAQLLAELDALVVPSTDLESAPRTIAEAQAAGCIVVASAIGGIAEMLENGDAGLLVAPGDPHALQKALGHVVRDEEWRAHTVHRARRRASEHYRLGAFARRCEEVFARAAASAGERPPTG